MNPMPDTVIDELREVRHQISASFGHDAAKLVAYLMQYQKQFHDRLLYVPDEISLDNQNRTPAVARCRGKRIKPISPNCANCKKKFRIGSCNPPDWHGPVAGGPCDFSLGEPQPMIHTLRSLVRLLKISTLADKPSPAFPQTGLK